MKKLFKYIFASALSLSALCLTSCHDSIYEEINKEVKLESWGINGDIYSIIRAGDYIYLSNGKIYYKTNKPSSETGLQNRQWHKTNTPSTYAIDYVPATTNYIASDSNYIYALTLFWYENSSGVNKIKYRKIYAAEIPTAASSGLSWKEIDCTPISATTSSNIRIIFDNQAVESADRAAYVNLYSDDDEAFHVYKLNGTNQPQLIPDGTNGTGSDTISAVYFPKNGQTYFSGYYTMTANDEYIYYTTTTTNSSNRVSTDSKIYRANGYGTYTSSGSEITGFTLDSEAAVSTSCDASGILSLAVTKNYLLVGSTSGLHRVVLSSTGDSTSIDKIPYTKCAAFPSQNNGESIITEYCFKVFVLNPDLNESEGDEYCTSTIYGSVSGSSDSWDETGLYAYYPGRGKWNRDGTSNTSSNGN